MQYNLNEKYKIVCTLMVKICTSILNSQWNALLTIQLKMGNFTFLVALQTWQFQQGDVEEFHGSCNVNVTSVSFKFRLDLLNVYILLKLLNSVYFIPVMNPFYCYIFKASTWLRYFVKRVTKINKILNYKHWNLFNTDQS